MCEFNNIADGLKIKILNYLNVFDFDLDFSSYSDFLLFYNSIRY